MSELMLPRRHFLQATAAGAAGLVFARSAFGAESGPIHISEPFHGAVLSHRYGAAVDGGLKITVRGEAAGAAPVAVNGAPATRDGSAFTADVVLRHTETDIVATCGDAKSQVRVVWDRYSQPRYRFTIDDNIYFLRDIAQKQYRSLFECPYLAMLQGMNKKYGAKFSLNLFYADEADFNLSQFPDRYRSEWSDNADWLRLAFHAYKERPSYPYKDAPAGKLLADMDLINTEIRRFAGEAYSPVTVVHFCMTRNDVFEAMATRDVRVLSGYFRPVAGGGWDINYSLDPARSEYLWTHEALKDFASGIVFSRVDIVVNTKTPEQIVPTLEPLTGDPKLAEFMDLLSHEQYFWPFYKLYEPDYAERTETAIRFVTERGYKPVHFHDGYLDRPA